MSKFPYCKGREGENVKTMEENIDYQITGEKDWFQNVGDKTLSIVDQGWYYGNHRLN